MRTIAFAILFVVLALVYFWQALHAQNMSQMGNRGSADCTTAQCIENVRRVTHGEAPDHSVCVTDKECAEAAKPYTKADFERDCERYSRMDGAGFVWFGVRCRYEAP